MKSVQADMILRKRKGKIYEGMEKKKLLRVISHSDICYGAYMCKLAQHRRTGKGNEKCSGFVFQRNGNNENSGKENPKEHEGTDA